MNDTEQNLSSQQTDGSWFDRWFDNSPILPTGQKKIAYQAAGLAGLVSELVGIFAVIMILQSDVDPGTAIGGSLILDAVLIIGLFAGEPAARNFTLFRVFVGVVISPFLVTSQFGIVVGIVVFLNALIGLWIAWLLLVEETTKRRIFQALTIQMVVAGIGIVFSIYVIQYLIATENSLDLRCDVVAYNAKDETPGVILPIQDRYKPGLTTKTFDEFTFSVDYSYQPQEDSRRHVITMTVTSSETGQLLSRQLINSLTNQVVKNVENILPRGIAYSASGWMIVQHPNTHRNLRYICVPYPYQPDISDDQTPFGAFLKQFYEDRRR